MYITEHWLKDHRACHSGIAWFWAYFPDGAERNDILLKLKYHLDWYHWLLKNTLAEESLPDDWVFPQEHHQLIYLELELELEGGTLQKGIKLQ